MCMNSFLAIILNLQTADSHSALLVFCLCVDGFLLTFIVYGRQKYYLQRYIFLHFPKCFRQVATYFTVLSTPEHTVRPFFSLSTDRKYCIAKYISSFSILSPCSCIMDDNCSNTVCSDPYHQHRFQFSI